MTEAPKGPYDDIAPALGQFTSEVLFGNLWKRSSLSTRDRSLVTISALVANYRQNELPYHLKRGLENGLTKDEIIETITHLAFYAGWPCANTAIVIARQFFSEQGHD